MDVVNVVVVVVGVVSVVSEVVVAVVVHRGSIDEGDPQVRRVERNKVRVTHNSKSQSPSFHSTLN